MKNRFILILSGVSIVLVALDIIFGYMVKNAQFNFVYDLFLAIYCFVAVFVLVIYIIKNK